MRSIIRKPNIKKSIKARTTGKIKREIKSTVNPLYGKKGIDYITDPKKAVYNKVYHKTSVPFYRSGDIFLHIFLLIFTLGIGNIILIIIRSTQKNKQ